MANSAKTYARSVDGLIDACFDQLEDLRDGISNSNETIAFAKAAEMIIRGVETNLKARALQYAHDQRMAELSNDRLELERQTLLPASTIVSEGDAESECIDNEDAVMT